MKLQNGWDREGGGRMKKNKKESETVRTTEDTDLNINSQRKYRALIIDYQ